jgi:SAM-dependent methyltransferase
VTVPSIYTTLRQLMLPLAEIDASLPDHGTILDLGSGQGVIASHLAQRPARTVIGVDADAGRIAKGNHNNHLGNLRFEVGDATNLALTDLDGVVISDVLHHLSEADAIEALASVARSLRPGGVLVVKEIDRDEAIRSRLSLFWDRVLYPKDRIHYFSRAELERLLTGLGFSVTVTRTTRLFPGSTTLFVGTRGPTGP